MQTLEAVCTANANTEGPQNQIESTSAIEAQ